MLSLKGTIEPLPEFKPYESFQYSAAGLRAPFSKPVDVKLIKNIRMKRQNMMLNQILIGPRNIWKALASMR